VLRFSPDVDLPRAGGPGVVLLRDLVHEHTGLFFDDGRVGLMMGKLTPLIVERGLSSALDYYYLLKYDADAAPEWRRVLDALAVQETYFWREIDQLRAVVDHVVPQHVQRLGGRPLRIWSVPCATGEEPLTLTMLLDDAGWFRQAPIELHGSDGSAAAIARARDGLYRERAFRALPPALRERYFTRVDGGWRVDPALHARVRWSIVNVVAEAQALPLADAPIIFCRNLFIYFSETSIRRTVDFFARTMPSPAHLCVGVSESLLNHTQDFELEEIGGAFMYVKP
jgi:chemotaxis protein methyltransferase CheR